MWKCHLSVYAKCKKTIKMTILNTSKHVNYSEHISDNSVAIQKKTVKCAVCEKDCSSAKYFLYTHLSFHAGKLIRRWCCFVVIVNSSIINKLKLIHFQDVKPIECTYDGCQYRFSIESDLQDHINKRHTFKKPHQCGYCGQSFATRSERSSHTRVHMDEKKYHCTICHKPFARSSGLNNHTRVHTGERPYKWLNGFNRESLLTFDHQLCTFTC